MADRWTREDFAELEAIQCVLCHKPWDPEHRMYSDGKRYVHKACLDYAKAEQAQERLIWTPPEGSS